MNLMEEWTKKFLRLLVQSWIEDSSLTPNLNYLVADAQFLGPPLGHNLHREPFQGRSHISGIFSSGPSSIFMESEPMFTVLESDPRSVSKKREWISTEP